MRDRREAIAQHEATHAVTAQKMGLPVSWVSIEDGLEEGIRFTAAVHIPDDQIDLERDLFAVLVSMAAPSFLDTYDSEIDAYARREATAAYRLADRHDLDSGWVYDEAATIADDARVEILDLADRLLAEGKVVFERERPLADASGTLEPIFAEIPAVLAQPYREPTREERAARNSCNLCTPWLIEGSDERLLEISDYRKFIRVTRLYRNRVESDALFAEWKRRRRRRRERA